MITKLKVIISDTDIENHDYSLIETKKYFTYGETGFDVISVSPNDNILCTINENRDVDVIITIGGRDNFVYRTLDTSSFQIRKKWCHFTEFQPKNIANTIINVFVNNINRKEPQNLRLFSFFTCTFNTPKEYLHRLYLSMLNQTYSEWNWYVLDDSTNSSVIDTLKGFNDNRIVIYKNETNHGVIGFNKHTIAMACNGDYLVEVDHDDELTNDCLYYLNKAFDEFPETDFVYSNAYEEIGGKAVIYGNNWGWGEGMTKREILNGTEVEFSASPEINPFSIRTIYAQPNHVRCWKSDFYHRIGGHNISLGVLDDMDLIIRTFLHGKITKVEKILYIQHGGKPMEMRGDTTQGHRFKEIQRTCYLLYRKYDKQIHDRIIELGFSDYAWDEKNGCSSLNKEHIPGLEVMSNLLVV